MSSRSKTGKSRTVDDLWTKIESEPLELDSEQVETTVLFVGDSGSGKSTLINSFLKASSSKQPKPTFALDYSFARKKSSSATSSSAAGKSVAHVWELGGDINEPGLLDVPITVHNVSSLSVVVCCDLSKPQNILKSMRKWIKVVREILAKRFSAYESVHEKKFEVDEGRKAQFEGHCDKRILSLFKIPLYIVGNKYDIFRDTDSLERRSAVQILRFLSHYYGATLLCASSVDSGLRDSFKNFINAVCFRLPLKQAYDINHEKPVYIYAGKDTFESILLGSKSGESGPESSQSSAPVSKSRLASSEADLSIYITSNGLTKDCWTRLSEHLHDTYGVGPDEDPKLKIDDKDDTNEYPEPEIDEMRAQRDTILKRYIQVPVTKNNITYFVTVSCRCFQEAERREAIQSKMSSQQSSNKQSSRQEDDDNNQDDYESKTSEGSSRRARK